jgi:hypothetical protein
MTVPSGRGVVCGRSTLSGGASSAPTAGCLMPGPSDGADQSAEAIPRCASTSPGCEQKADESIAAPKGRGSRTPCLSPANRALLGTAARAIIAFLGPVPSATRWWAKADGPLARAPEAGMGCAGAHSV